MRKRVVFAALALGLAALLAVLLANMQDHGPGDRFDANRPEAEVPVERGERPPAEEVVSSTETTTITSAETPEEEEETEHGGLRVVVVDENEVPVADAKLYIYAHREGTRGDTKSFVTDATGKVSEPELLPGWANVHLYLDGYSLSKDTNIHAGKTAEVRIVLPATVAVEGTVRHLEKGLLGRVAVRLERRGKGAEVGLSTTTDAKGRFRLDAVPTGDYDVGLSGTEIGYSPRPRAILEVRVPGPVVREFLLGIVRLRGRIVDADGEPVGAVEVTLYRNNFYASSATDANGEFVFLDLPPGTYSLTMSRGGFGLKSKQIEIGDEVLDLEFALKHAARVRFRFTDTDGNPVAGRHNLYLKGETGVGTTVTAVEQGYARYDKVVPGPYGIRVRTPGYAEFKSEIEIKPGDNEIPVVLTPLGERGEPVLTGTVRDAETGDPIPGARINLESGYYTAVSDQKGVFRFRNFTMSKCSLWIRKEGYGLESFRDIELTEGKTVEREFPLRRAGILHFILTDKHGKPVVGRCSLSISPLTEGGSNFGTGITADAEGRATFPHIVPGRYQLRVHHGGAQSERVETTIHLGEQTLRLGLE